MMTKSSRDNVDTFFLCHRLQSHLLTLQGKQCSGPSVHLKGQPLFQAGATAPPFTTTSAQGVRRSLNDKALITKQFYSLPYLISLFTPSPNSYSLSNFPPLSLALPLIDPSLILYSITAHY